MERVELRRIDMELADIGAVVGVWWGVTAVIVAAAVVTVGDLAVDGTASDMVLVGGATWTKVEWVFN